MHTTNADIGKNSKRAAKTSLALLGKVSVNRWKRFFKLYIYIYIFYFIYLVFIVEYGVSVQSLGLGAVRRGIRGIVVVVWWL